MLDFSWGHILIVLIVALVVVGPKDLPRLMRVAGQWAKKARKVASQVRSTFDDMARESELDELRKEVNSLKKNPSVSPSTQKPAAPGAPGGSANRNATSGAAAASATSAELKSGAP